MKRTIVASLLLVTGLFLVGAASADDSKPVKHVVAHTSLAGKDISRTVATVGDAPNHELVQRVYSYAISSDDKDFDQMRSENYAQTDTTDGKGTHTGYAIWKNTQDESFQVKFNGEHHPEGSGAGNAEFSGDFTVLGGTGKFHAITGKGTYKGHITPSGQTSEVLLDARY